MSQKYQQQSHLNKHYIGRQIRASHVLCIDHNNLNRGTIPLFEALKIAEENGLDLVQMGGNGKIPACKILDYGKFKYEESKNEKLARKKQRENEVKTKELQFKINTDTNDLKTKANKAREFLNNGDKVKVTIMLKGRAIQYVDLAKQTMYNFIDLLPEAKISEDPLLNGKTLTAILDKKAA